MLRLVIRDFDKDLPPILESVVWVLHSSLNQVKAPWLHFNIDALENAENNVRLLLECLRQDVDAQARAGESCKPRLFQLVLSKKGHVGPIPRQDLPKLLEFGFTLGHLMDMECSKQYVARFKWNSNVYISCLYVRPTCYALHVIIHGGHGSADGVVLG